MEPIYNQNRAHLLEGAAVGELRRLEIRYRENPNDPVIRDQYEAAVYNVAVATGQTSQEAYFQSRQAVGKKPRGNDGCFGALIVGIGLNGIAGYIIADQVIKHISHS